MKIESISFDTRDLRYQYAAKTYGDVLRGEVLDVGCDKGQLRTFLPPDTQYTGTDIGGSAEYKLNLEEIDRLPFEDGRFDCVICTEVLEHIDTLHFIFEELVRVTRAGGHLIISLPNCWRALRTRLPRGHGTPQYYGLPAEKPVDRHKWFFNVSDIVGFMQGNEKRLPIRVKQFTATEKPRPGIFAMQRLARRAWYLNIDHYLNRYADSLWTLLEKTK